MSPSHQFPAKLQSEFHFGDIEATILPISGVSDRLGSHYVLFTSHPDENAVQQLPTPRSLVHPGCLLPHRKTEECVGWQETVVYAGSQEQRIITLTAAETMRTQHSQAAW
nr:unnamed protein product [Spirometra erinaceieuropaei]